MSLLTRPTNELLKRLVFLANTRGIIPNPVTAMRVWEQSPDIDNGNHTLYTVGAGQRLYIVSCWVTVRNDSAVQAGGILRWTNNGGVAQREILSPYCRASGHESLSLTFLPGIEIPTTHKVILYSTVAACYVKSAIMGWVEDV